MKFVLTILLSWYFAAHSYAQGKRPKIKDFLNQEVKVTNSFAGESMTLIKEGRNYFVLRKIFGSGLPVIREYKYYVAFNSDYKISFSDINTPYRENFTYVLKSQTLGCI